MNKKIKMYIICAIFMLISSCKNDVTSKDLEGAVKDLESSEQNVKKTEQEIKKQVEGFLEILETKDLNTLDTKEIEKQIQELKNKIEKLDSKKTSIETYSGYEEKINKIKEKLNGKGLEDKLNELSESLKKKKEERKKALQEAKKKFEEYKNQAESATGVTHGSQVQRQGGVGLQAWQCANSLGFKNMTSGNNTSDMTNEVITNSLKKIEEELKNIGETVEGKKE